MSKKHKAANTIALVTKQEMDIGIKSGARAKLAEKLGAVLASNYLLGLKTQNYHWNVTGIHFISLHEMFAAQYADINTANDELAERIRALGYPAPASFREYNKLSFLKEESATPEAAETMVENLLNDHEAMARECRDLAEMAENAGDGVTTDLMVVRMESHEKTAWMLRATLRK